ncbi:MAG: SGNH/GDSL hydrolase family protein [Clostridiales bacterium]|nr:SGNH/GDSL hydrolase family protein [Clostridiales bacterium]
MLTIALYGDSIGRGVAYDEARGRYHYLRDGFDRLMEKEGLVRFLNHSRFGATAREGLEELEKLTGLDADAVVVEYGGNDCSPDWKAVSEDPETLHPPRTTLADFEDILARFVRKIRGLGKIAVLVTPPPLVAERFVPWVSKGLDENAILRFLGDTHHVYRWQEQYALSVHQVARQTRSRLFDLRAWFLKERDLGSLYCADGMHPNQKGHALIARAAADMLPRIWEE